MLVNMINGRNTRKGWTKRLLEARVHTTKVSESPQAEVAMIVQYTIHYHDISVFWQLNLTK